MGDSDSIGTETSICIRVRMYYANIFEVSRCTLTVICCTVQDFGIVHTRKLFFCNELLPSNIRSVSSKKSRFINRSMYIEYIHITYSLLFLFRCLHYSGQTMKARPVVLLLANCPFLYALCSATVPLAIQFLVLSNSTEATLFDVDFQSRIPKELSDSIWHEPDQ